MRLTSTMVKVCYSVGDKNGPISTGVCGVTLLSIDCYPSALKGCEFL